MNTDDLNKDLNSNEEEKIESPYSAEAQPKPQEEPVDDVVFEEDIDADPADVVKKLRAKLKTAVEEKQKYLDSWQRDKAEFVNARKRDEESKADFLKFSTQKVIEDLLPVLDSFEMAMGNKVAWESVSKEWRTGVEGIYQQFLRLLAPYEVSQFGEIGDAFDPNLHHSIAMVTAEDKAKDHTIAEILQKGYKIKDKVLRPALVKVFET